MWDSLQSSLIMLKVLRPMKIIFGIFLSILEFHRLRYTLWSPFKWAVAKSDNKWDDELMKLATPLVNYAVFLLGVYLTVILSIEEDSIFASITATFVVLVLMLLSGKFLSQSASLILPGALETLDNKVS